MTQDGKSKIAMLQSTNKMVTTRYLVIGCVIHQGMSGRRELEDVLIFGADVRHDILIEELENQWDTIGEHQVLRHELELVDVIHLQMFQQQQQYGRHGLH